MKYPAYDIYEILYARYFKRGPSALFEDINLNDKTLLDICGGTGRLTLYAVDQGAKVTYLDAERDMCRPEIAQAIGNKNIFIGQVTDHLRSWEGTKHFLDISFDIVACQQAITYWLNRYTAKRIADITKEYFIFNIFNTKPSEKLLVKEYYLESTGLNYMECSQLIGEYVHHVQCADGITPHTTQFKWISREELTVYLSPYFDLEEKIDGPTSIWVCKKKIC